MFVSQHVPTVQDCGQLPVISLFSGICGLELGLSKSLPQIPVCAWIEPFVWPVGN